MKGKKLRGIACLIYVTAVGILVWRWEDDAGWVHTHKISNSLLVPEVPFCVLSPQHWVQERKDHFPYPNGTCCEILAEASILKWLQIGQKMNVPYDPQTNTAKFYAAS
eukprot:6244253-Ditylum_brightwellii.AAC.1